MKMNISRIEIIGAAGLLFCAGCASTKSASGGGSVWTPQANARNLARETLAQVVDYEDVINQVNKAYSDYTKSSLADLESSVTAQADTAVRQQRDLLAREEAEKALVRGVQPSEFRDYVLAYQDAGKQAQSRLVSSYSAIVERDKSHQAKLEALQKALKTTRDKLDRLQVEPSFKDQIEEFRVYYKMARESYDQAKKKSAQ